MANAHPAPERKAQRLEDPQLLRGMGQFVDDIRIPGQLHAAFVRSAHAHAIVRGIEMQAALDLPGVVAVYSYATLRPLLTQDRIAQELPSGYMRFQVNPFPLVDTEATYVGEPVVMVVAESRRIAEDASGLVEVDYDPLPAVVDPVEADAKGSAKARLDCPDNRVAQTTVSYGDADAAFAGAHLVFDVRFVMSKGGGHAMEGRGIATSYDAPTDMMTVWNSTQMPHRCKTILCDMLGLAEHQLRVIAPDVGGGFGPKAVFHPEELVVVAASRALQRPVKWIEDRFESFAAAVMERDQTWDMEVAVDADGRLRGIRGKGWHDHGSCTPYGFAIPYNTATNMIGNYVIPAFNVEVIWSLTNKVPTSSTRGAGRPQGTFMMERVLDMAATRLGIDRAEIRRRNLIPADKMPYCVPIRMRDGSQMTYDSGDYPTCQAEVMRIADWDGFEARRQDSAARGLLRGIGLANYVELTGRGPFESVGVRVGPSGQVLVTSGGTAQGQGHKTMLANIVGDILGVDPQSINVQCGDTAATHLGVGAFASRQAVTAGNSARVAAQEVRQKALNIAASMLQARADDLDLTDGIIRLKGNPDPKSSLAAIARAMNGSIGFPVPGRHEPGLFATSNFQTTGTPFANGSHVVEVEVDPETAGVRLVRYTVMHDCGTVLNPAIVDGQVAGGVVHGIGMTLYERMLYDDQGQPLTVTYGDYLLPTSDTVPHMEICHMESPSPLNPLGVKGAGEGGTIGAPAAIASAIEHALNGYGVVIRDLPITPATLHRDVAASRRSRR